MIDDKIISFDPEFDELDSSLRDTKKSAAELDQSIGETGGEIAELLKEFNEFQKEMPGAPRALVTREPIETPETVELNRAIDRLVIPDKKLGPTLSAIDIILAVSAGVVASVIDIVFVGTPEVVKIYKGGENFDGSILTGILHKIGNGNDKLSEILKWLSEQCKVPYDISCKKDVVVPNNHRLRSFAHDPLFGVLFAVVDIIMGTCTVIDNNGKIRVLVNQKDYPITKKYFALIVAIGHLISDVCTARGLPIPGFITTQLFAGGDHSIAKIAEGMYLDGYDLRHLASMEVPVAIKNLIINLYIRIFKKQEPDFLSTIAEKELQQNAEIAFKYKMILISDAVACGGNVLKFFIPPTSGNITALNLPEWCSLLKNTIYNLKYELRDKTIEKVNANRDAINQNWEILRAE